MYFHGNSFPLSLEFGDLRVRRRLLWGPPWPYTVCSLPQPSPLGPQLPAFSSSLPLFQQHCATCCTPPPSPNPVGTISPPLRIPALEYEFRKGRDSVCFIWHIVGLQLGFLELNYAVRPRGSALLVARIRPQNEGARKPFCLAAFSNLLSGTLLTSQEQRQ